MKEIIAYLRRLQANNNREWFNAHKDEFLKHQARFHELVEEVIKEIAVFDPVMANLTPKDCTYRIYRDVRFSSDKSPYKNAILGHSLRKAVRNRVIPDIISISVRGVERNIRIVTCWRQVIIVVIRRC